MPALQVRGLRPREYDVSGLSQVFASVRTFNSTSLTLAKTSWYGFTTRRMRPFASFSCFGHGFQVQPKRAQAVRGNSHEPSPPQPLQQKNGLLGGACSGDLHCRGTRGKATQSAEHFPNPFSSEGFAGSDPAAKLAGRLQGCVPFGASWARRPSGLLIPPPSPSPGVVRLIGECARGRQEGQPGSLPQAQAGLSSTASAEAESRTGAVELGRGRCSAGAGAERQPRGRPGALVALRPWQENCGAAARQVFYLSQGWASAWRRPGALVARGKFGRLRGAAALRGSDLTATTLRGSSSSRA